MEVRLAEGTRRERGTEHSEDRPAVWRSGNGRSLIDRYRIKVFHLIQVSHVIGSSQMTFMALTNRSAALDANG